MNRHPEYLVLVWLFPSLVVYTFITHLAMRDDLVPIFTCQNETSLQAPVVLDIGVYHHIPKDGRCVMFVTHECPKWKHLDMETDPTSVNKITSFRFLFLHGISLPLQVIFQPFIDAILVNDTKVAQSIIGKFENLEFPGMCPHEVVCHDCDETLRIITQTIQDELLCYLNELFPLIKHLVQWFHFLSLFPSGNRTHIFLSSSFLRRKSFLVRVSFIHFLYMSPSMV